MTGSSIYYNLLRLTTPNLSFIRPMSNRIDREKRTIKAMINIFCREQHGSKAGGLCDECNTLMQYAYLKLDKCRFKDQKPTCAKCPIHCYRPDMRERVKGVMRFSGPKMTLRHPWLALCHLIDGLRSPKG
jgi:hypothetical protein